jgi:hypothetical protein
MGNSHYKSHLIAKQDGVNITGFSTCTVATVVATNLVVGTAMTAPTITGSTSVRATSYVKIGSKYIFVSSKNTAASLPAEATLTAGVATILGSIVLAGNAVYRFTSNTAASQVDVT